MDSGSEADLCPRSPNEWIVEPGFVFLLLWFSSQCFSTVLCFLHKAQVHCSFCWIQSLESLVFLLSKSSIPRLSSMNSYSLCTILNKFDSSFLFPVVLTYSLTGMSFFSVIFFSLRLCFTLFLLVLTLTDNSNNKISSSKTSREKVWLKALLKKRRSLNSGNILYQLAYQIPNEYPVI